MKLWYVMAPTQIINLYSGYSMYEQNDPLHYRSKFRHFLKKQVKLTNWTVDHHIFPKCLANHPLLKDMNINCGKNIKIMPHKKAMVDSSILRHTNHILYTRHVQKKLNKIYFEKDEENKNYQLYLLLHDLEKKLDFGDLPF